MLLGGDKRSAAEFSFFLAIPTMVGAFAYDFYKNRGEMTIDHVGVIAIGFVVSFITAMIVVKTFLTYVTRHGFTFFAWWRVIIGTLGLIAPGANCRNIACSRASPNGSESSMRLRSVMARMISMISRMVSTSGPPSS